MTASQLIHETIVTTRRADRGAHIVPLGIRHQGDLIVLAPFRPSATLENVLRERCAVVNFTDDVRVFAGCLTGRHAWPTVSAERVSCQRLAASLAHTELELVQVEEDEQRPRLLCRPVLSANHGAFCGFNRAQAAVVEACILVSRLSMLPEEKVRREMDYLAIAISKTAGPRELEAWNWLQERIDRFAAERRQETP